MGSIFYFISFLYIKLIGRFVEFGELSLFRAYHYSIKPTILTYNLCLDSNLPIVQTTSSNSRCFRNARKHWLKHTKKSVKLVIGYQMEQQQQKKNISNYLDSELFYNWTQLLWSVRECKFWIKKKLLRKSPGGLTRKLIYDSIRFKSHSFQCLGLRWGQK